MALVEFQNNQPPYINADNLNEIQKGNIYSFDEVEIGKWVHGETLYRKCFTFNNELTTRLVIPHGIVDAKTVMIKYASLHGPSNGETLGLPLVGYGGNFTSKTYAMVDRNNIYLYNESGSWGNSWYKIIILEYTKL